MASVIWDVGQYVLGVYEGAQSNNLEAMTKEELIRYIKSEAQEAKKVYLDLAVDHGWYKTHEDGEEDLGTDEDYTYVPLTEEQERKLDEAFNRHIKEEVEPALYADVEGVEALIRIREWLSVQLDVDNYLLGKVAQETDKALYFVVENPFNSVWIPKSQIIFIEK